MLISIRFLSWFVWAPDKTLNDIYDTVKGNQEWEIERM